MLDSPIIRDAYYFSLAAHNGQKRKYVEMDYFVHPLRVSAMVDYYLAIPSVTAAALLHDTVEDTDVTIKNISDQFGGEVAQYVFEVTNQSGYSDGNRKERKRIDRDHLSLSSPEGASIKLADIIDNTTDIVAFDPGFARTYLQEKTQVLPLLSHGHGRLHTLAWQSLEAGIRRLEES